MRLMIIQAARHLLFWRVLFFLLIALLLGIATLHAQTTGSWTPIGGKAFGAGVTATPLPNGDVILIGGSTTSPPLITVFHPDAVTGNTFNVLNTGGDLDGCRDFHSATLLKDGQILLAGGFCSDLSHLQVKGELYDPVARRFTPVGQMSQPRFSHSATLLRDGTVLIVGGISPNGFRNSNAAEIYDPVTRQFTSVGPMAMARGGHTATLLPSGNVLIVGGDSAIVSTAELYDPSSRQFTFLGPTFFPNRSGHSATLLRNGKVLIAGGNGTNTGGNATNAAELYDPSIGSLGGFVGTGPLNIVRSFHAAALLSDGKVLIAGGNNVSTQAELYDPGKGQFTSAGLMSFSHQQPASALLPNGKVVVFGSVIPSAGSELYTPFLTVTASGFQAEFSTPMDVNTVNLYRTETGGQGPADVTVIGATTGPVAGSLLVSADGLRITFVKTGGPLIPDTYTVTLRSAYDGFKTVNGVPLDGNGDGIPGDDYVTTFTVAPTTLPVLSLPDFARGPVQAVNVPANSLGLPIRLSEGAGITSLSFDVVYDPTLLTVAGATLGATMPDAVAKIDFSLPGRTRLTVQRLVATGTSVVHIPATPAYDVPAYDYVVYDDVACTSRFVHSDGYHVDAQPASDVVVTTYETVALSSGPLDIVLTATVPTCAPYRAAGLLRIENVYINGTPGGAVADDAVQVVARLGDTTGDGSYSSLDGQRVLRVAAGLDTGFAAYPLIDPVIIGDITGDGRISSLDATRILQKVSGVSVPVPTNLALNKPATASSILGPCCGSPPSYSFSNPSGFVPSFAIDGTSTTFAHTGWLSEPQPWWQVDLGSVASIQTIVISPRADRDVGPCIGICPRQLSDFYVLVSDAPFGAADLNTTLAQPGVASYFWAGPAGIPTTLTVNRTGRYVRVQLQNPSAEALSIGELQVIGTLP